LIFEAALYIAWPALRKDLPVVLTLATLGVVLSVGVTTLGMHYWAHWSWPAALLFGVLISATDPVSVIATFKEAGVHGRLRALVEAESLLNDSTAAVGFSVAIAWPPAPRSHRWAPFSSWRSRSLRPWPAAAQWQQRSWPWPGRNRGSPGGDHLHHHCCVRLLLAGGIPGRVRGAGHPHRRNHDGQPRPIGAPSRRRDARPWCRSGTTPPSW